METLKYRIFSWNDDFKEKYYHIMEVSKTFERNMYLT